MLHSRSAALCLLVAAVAGCEDMSLLQFSQTGLQDSGTNGTVAAAKPGDKRYAPDQVAQLLVPLVPMFDAAPSAQSWVLVESLQSPKAAKEYWIMTVCLILLILLAISPIASKKVLQSCCSSCSLACSEVMGVSLSDRRSYLTSLVSVKVFVKETINQGFPYPESITAMHMLGVCLVTGSLQRPHIKEALAVLPISLLHGASLMTNNTALLYGGVAFVSMISANIPFIIFLLEVGKKKRTMDCASVAAVLLVCCGSIFCVYGEPAASVSAFLLASASALLGAMRAVWQHEVVVISLSPLNMVFWNGFWSFCISVLLIASNERTKAFRSLPGASSDAKWALLASAVTAVVLNITQWYAVQKLGALMQSMIGNLNLILVMALSGAYLQEHVTFAQYVGVLLLSLGTFWNKAREIMKEQAEQGSQDGSCAEIQTGHDK
ncbi:unnamed protein product [Cladocopium goreaui]|uniref:Probable sugar phosphate/phosphate translocator At3g14410 n=1 Tax=Cladocopium goreaui TaxID=2562237 RepID=A0A9P1CXS5_9DINO|nr:unnamed protein product [Cladocopium goreaui]